LKYKYLNEKKAKWMDAPPASVLERLDLGSLEG
jgi:hypothetical protein